MITCDKCGARLDDGMKYCDKCGSEISQNPASGANIVGLDDIKPLEDAPKKEKRGFKSYIDTALSMLPHPLAKECDRTSLMIGLASLFALALVYVICLFAFMADISMPISIGVVAEYDGSLGGITKGASPLWMIFYFLLHLAPVYFAASAFFNKKYRLYSVFACAFFFVITLFTLISWGICAPDTIIESIDTYQNSGSIAWYALLDSLSEAWYLKIIFSLAAIFGMGVDYIINKGK